MANPTLLTSPIAENGDKNVIPATTGATTGLLDQEHGFQQINELPLQAGGLPPQRKDFNGIFNLLSGIDYMTQRGYTFEWDATLPYVVGCIVRDTDGKLYRCINDVQAGGTQPSLDTTNWELYDCLPIAGETLAITGHSADNTIQKTLQLDSTGLLYNSDVVNYPNRWYNLGSNAIVQQSLGDNGYIVYANGFCMQWGITSSMSGAGTKTITFPIAFSVRRYFNCIAANIDGYTTEAPSFAFVSSVGGTSITVYSDKRNANGIRWFALGKA